MEERLSAEREKLPIFKEQYQWLDLEEQLFSAEKDAVRSLERDIRSKRQKLAVGEKDLGLAKGAARRVITYLLFMTATWKAEILNSQKIFHYMSDLQGTFSGRQRNLSSCIIKPVHLV